MPRIDQRIVRAVFFLYPSAADALKLKNAIGTGFFVGMGSKKGVGHYYAVTCKHILTKHRGQSVNFAIRLDVKDSSVPEINESTVDEWELHSDDDLAVLPIPLDDERHEAACLPFGNPFFLPKEYDDIGVGDDSFMMGLFADHRGRKGDTPLARFGNVSMLASKDALVSYETDRRLYERHIVDMHSRDGYCGSPVFVYRTFGADLTTGSEMVKIDAGPILEAADPERGNRSQGVVLTRVSPRTMFRFFGVHCGQFAETWRKSDGETIDGVSGLTTVVPAHKLTDLLFSEKLIQGRSDRDADLPAAAVLEATRESTGHLNPDHAEDFNSLLDAAVRGKPSAD